MPRVLNLQAQCRNDIKSVTFGAKNVVMPAKFGVKSVASMQKFVAIFVMTEIS